MSTGFKAGVSTLVFTALLVGTIPAAYAQTDFDKVRIGLPLGAIIIKSNSLLQAKSAVSTESAYSKPEMDAKFRVYVTAYSSSEDETDSTPHLTASGTKTRDGVLASNIFPIGTRVKIPELFGNQIFVIEDRMHERYSDRIDVWMPSKAQALRFGKRQTEVQIVVEL